MNKSQDLNHLFMVLIFKMPNQDDILNKNDYISIDCLTI